MNKKNTCGIIGLILSFIIPIAGLVLGIISLTRKEPKNVYGILAITFAVVSWIIGIMILASLGLI